MYFLNHQISGRREERKTEKKKKVPNKSKKGRREWSKERTNGKEIREKERDRR